MSSVRFALHSASAATLQALGGGAVAPHGMSYGTAATDNPYRVFSTDRPSSPNAMSLREVAPRLRKATKAPRKSA